MHDEIRVDAKKLKNNMNAFKYTKAERVPHPQELLLGCLKDALHLRDKTHPNHLYSRIVCKGKCHT